MSGVALVVVALFRMLKDVAPQRVTDPEPVLSNFDGSSSFSSPDEIFQPAKLSAVPLSSVLSSEAEPLPFIGHIKNTHVLSALALSISNCTGRNIAIPGSPFFIEECAQPSRVEYCFPQQNVEDDSSKSHCERVAHLVLRLYHHGEEKAEADRVLSFDDVTSKWIKKVAGPLNIFAIGFVDGKFGWSFGGFSIYRRTLNDYVVMFPLPLLPLPARSGAQAEGDSKHLGSTKASAVRVRLRIKCVQRAFEGIDEVAPTTRRTWSQYVVPKDAVAKVMAVDLQLSALRLHLRRPNLLQAWRNSEDKTETASTEQSARKSTTGIFPSLSHLRGGTMRYLPLTWAGNKVNIDDDDGGLSSVAANERCISGKTLLVTGDSQSRSLFWAIRESLQKGFTQSAAPLNKPGSEPQHRDAASVGKITHAYFELRSVRLRYVWDSYLANISRSMIFEESTMAETDVIVVGMGAHAASWGQWTLRKYHSEMVRIARTLCGRLPGPSSSGSPGSNSHGRVVVWYGAPAWPKHKSVENFRATNLRLGAFNAIAEQVLRSVCSLSSVKLRFVDFFHMTYSVPQLSKDGAHYDKSIVAPTVAAAVAAASC